MSDNCPVCQTALNKKQPITVSGPRYSGPSSCNDCPRCGKFVFLFRERDLDLMVARVCPHDKDWRSVLSHHIRKMQKNDEEIDLDDNLVKAILKKTPPSLNEQINNIILWLGQATRPGELLGIEGKTHQSIMGAINFDGFGFVLDHLKERGFIESSVDPGTARCEGYVKLLFEGWEYYRELEKGAIDSRKAFMAMKYGDAELDKIVEDHFAPAVAETGFELYRLDKDPKGGLIDDRLRVEIRNSRFLISDLTHDNSGAYWEAGYAEGLGKPVIYTCKKEKFDEDKSHFDTNHHLTVLWDADNIEDAVKSLKATIRATLPGEAKMSDD